MIGSLLSYADTSARRQSLAVTERLAERNIPLVWDSGAWSVFTGAAKVSVEEHAAWVMNHPCGRARFIGLDVIGDPEATLLNYRTQREAGASVEPTIHYGERIDQVRKLLDVADTEWFNIGGLVPQLSRNKTGVSAFIAAVKRELPPEVKVHALGCTTPDVLRSVPVDASDSTSWLSGQKYRKPVLFNPRTGRWTMIDLATKSSARRLDGWRTSHRSGGWLRSVYEITPTEFLEVGYTEEGVLKCVHAVSLLAEWVRGQNGADMTIYLAGDDDGKFAQRYMDQNRLEESGS